MPRCSMFVTHPNAIIGQDRKSTRLNSSHLVISYAVFCLKKKKHPARPHTAGGSRPVSDAADRLQLARDAEAPPPALRPACDAVACTLPRRCIAHLDRPRT